jgi:ORF6N domain
MPVGGCRVGFAFDIAPAIRIVRGQRVLPDTDLALVYGVTVKRLNQQVRRNLRRFPPDFLISRTKQELADLRMQNESSSWGGRRGTILAFAEHGAIMVATVLNTPRRGGNNEPTHALRMTNDSSAAVADGVAAAGAVGGRRGRARLRQSHSG